MEHAVNKGKKKVGLRASTETSVSNRFTPRNSPESGIIKFKRGVSLRSRKHRAFHGSADEISLSQSRDRLS
jgi:hypothetical protein